MAIEFIQPDLSGYTAEARQIARLYDQSGYTAIRDLDDSRPHWRNAFKFEQNGMPADIAARFGFVAGTNYAALLALIEKDLAAHPVKPSAIGAGWTEGEHPEARRERLRAEAARARGGL